MGLGYIGLPTAVLIASKNFEVLGVDINSEVLEKLKNKELHIDEPELLGLFTNVVKEGKFFVSSTPEKADVFIIAVPTPINSENKPDLSYVYSATAAIIPFLEKNNLIVLESTSPVNTTDEIYKMIRSNRRDIASEIYVAYCPERVLPGKILYELVYNDRIIGGINEVSSIVAKRFYRNFVKGNIFVTDSRTAELVKLTENAYRDVNIAFANELSIICDKYGIDPYRLIKLANRHPRVNILNPACGVGGHCIAVDPWFIVSGDSKNTRLIQTAREVNSFKTDWSYLKIKKECERFENKFNKKPVIALLGLSYKPDVGDCRMSPALKIALLLKKDYKIFVVDNHVESSLEGFNFVEFEDALQFDIPVLLVAHSEFKDKIEELRKLKDKILDFTGLLS